MTLVFTINSHVFIYFLEYFSSLYLCISLSLGLLKKKNNNNNLSLGLLKQKNNNLSSGLLKNNNNNNLTTSQDQGRDLKLEANCEFKISRGESANKSHFSKPRFRQETSEERHRKERKRSVVLRQFPLFTLQVHDQEV